MIQILLLLFSLILILISWYFKKHISDLELVFSKANRQNIKHMAISFVILGGIGIILSFIIPTQIASLLFVSLTLIVSAVFSIRLSKNMK